MFAQILAPITLQNAHVRLEPLDLAHAEDLAALTVGTGVTRMLSNPLETRHRVDGFIVEALSMAARQVALPFAIVEPQGRVVGSTRFMNIVGEHRRLEIGWTFVGAWWQRTAINTAAKLLLLQHAFEYLNCERIELNTDARNVKSRNAISRIGATEEGVLRRHMICADGHHRDTVCFSIVAEEWPDVKRRLHAFLDLSG